MDDQNNNPKKPKKGQINIELDEKVAEGTYSNLAIINHSVSEFVVDFVSIMPGTPKSKVKSRMISHAMRNLMEQCSDVFVMGHEAPDLDCMGASLGICACARQVLSLIHI